MWKLVNACAATAGRNLVVRLAAFAVLLSAPFFGAPDCVAIGDAKQHVAEIKCVMGKCCG
jgi:hypothetical protein